jgi:hypothetical protein
MSIQIVILNGDLAGERTRREPAAVAWPSRECQPPRNLGGHVFALQATRRVSADPRKRPSHARSRERKVVEDRRPLAGQPAVARRSRECQPPRNLGEHALALHATRRVSAGPQERRSQPRSRDMVSPRARRSLALGPGTDLPAFARVSAAAHPRASTTRAQRRSPRSRGNPAISRDHATWSHHGPRRRLAVNQHRPTARRSPCHEFPRKRPRAGPRGQPALPDRCAALPRAGVQSRPLCPGSWSS